MVGWRLSRTPTGQILTAETVRKGTGFLLCRRRANYPSADDDSNGRVARTTPTPTSLLERSEHRARRRFDGAPTPRRHWQLWPRRVVRPSHSQRRDRARSQTAIIDTHDCRQPNSTSASTQAAPIAGRGSRRSRDDGYRAWPPTAIPLALNKSETNAPPTRAAKSAMIF